MPSSQPTPDPPGSRGDVDNVVDLRRQWRPTAPTEPAADPTPRLRDVLGYVLRDERRRQERTLAEVAGDAAVSLTYLSEVERGRKEVSSDVLDAVCRALDLELADVLERSTRRLRPGSQSDRGVQLRAA